MYFFISTQEKMLEKDQASEREKFRTIYEFHLKKTYQFFKDNSIPYIDITYSNLIEHPEVELALLKDFCGLNCDVNNLIEVVKPELYRNK